MTWLRAFLARLWWRIFTRALPWRTDSTPAPRAYLWRVFVKGQPKGYKCREVRAS